uniref:Uncharacterized protein n=1 Tax=Anguilla anguilla TaxID=7936 RepID=A0A0E9Q3U8_ANGAN
MRGCSRPLVRPGTDIQSDLAGRLSNQSACESDPANTHTYIHTHTLVLEMYICPSTLANADTSVAFHSKMSIGTVGGPRCKLMKENVK